MATKLTLSGALLIALLLLVSMMSAVSPAKPTGTAARARDDVDALVNLGNCEARFSQPQ